MASKEQLADANRIILAQESELAQERAEKKRLSTELASATERVANVEEGLNRVKAMMDRDNIGWALVGNAQSVDDEGLELEDLKEWSRKIRETTVGGSLLGRGFRFRANFVWRDNIKVNNPPAGGKGGASKKNIKAFINDPYNQDQFFSMSARHRRELSCFADGIYVAVGDITTKRIRPLPLEKISAIWVDPDNHDEIWAYRHSWSHRNSNGTATEMVEWIFTDFAKPHETDYVMWSGAKEKVNRNLTAFDEHPNRATGWALGTPDALAAFAWNNVVNKAYSDGISMTSAMAKLYAQVAAPSKAAAQSAAAALATITDAGATAVSGSQVNPLSSAGKGYAFDTLRPIIAMMATAMDVPTIALTSDTANAGSSYGAAQTLDEPTQYAMEARRDFHLPLDERVMRWAGWDEPNIRFLPLLSASDRFRVAQGINADFQTGLWTPEQTKQRSLALDGYEVTVDMTTIPSAVMIPNSRNEPDELSNDAQGDALAQQRSQATPAAKASGQGQSNDPSVGKLPQAQDARTDR